ncbi:MAG: glycosyltransferase, partial [Gemmatimonadaceae bacterium]
PWLGANGIPADAVLDIGRVPNALMGRVVREAHVALFPNRAEGGTNLVAMECMAAGVPTIVSSNTGHLDLVASGGCIPLRRQRVVSPPTRFYSGTEGWGESDVAEIVEVLERAHDDRAAVRAIGAQGASIMQGWSWRSQVERLITELRPLL